MKPFEQKLLESIRNDQLLESGDRVLIGLSGGADSLALFHFLKKYQDLLEIEIACCCLNHCLRDEACYEQEELRKLCLETETEFFTGSIDVLLYAKEQHLGTEEAGRELRYRYFDHLARRNHFTKIALGHHLNDQAETVLYRLFRGTGLNGIQGIRKKRDFGNSELIRPMLCVSKGEILTYLVEEGQCWFEDHSNKNLDYSRNYLRHRILKPILDYDRKALDKINRFTENMRESAELESLLMKPYLECYLKKVPDGTEVLEEVYMGRDSVFTSSAFRHTLIREACRIAGIQKDLNRKHIELIDRLFLSAAGGQIDLPGGYLALKQQRVYRIQKKRAVHENEASCMIDIGHISDEKWQNYSIDEKICLKAKKVSFRPSDSPFLDKKGYICLINCDNITCSLDFRTRRAGDYLVLGKDSGHKKINRFFIDKKIPKYMRDQIYFLAMGSEVLWIPGLYKNPVYARRIPKEDERTIYFALEG